MKSKSIIRPPKLQRERGKTLESLTLVTFLFLSLFPREGERERKREKEREREREGEREREREPPPFAWPPEFDTDKSAPNDPTKMQQRMCKC